MGCMNFLNYGFFPDICPGVGLPDHMMVLFFSFLRKLHAVLHSGYTSLHFYQQCRRVHFSSHLPQHLLRADSLMNDGHSDWCEAIPL